jgi:hypothetical protein
MKTIKNIAHRKFTYGVHKGANSNLNLPEELVVNEVKITYNEAKKSTKITYEGEIKRIINFSSVFFIQDFEGYGKMFDIEGNLIILNDLDKQKFPYKTELFTFSLENDLMKIEEN